MTEQEIIAGNTLIAEFMGYKVLYRPYGGDFVELSPSECCDVQDLQYHSSLDWLSVVLDKLENLIIKIHGIERKIKTSSDSRYEYGGRYVFRISYYARYQTKLVASCSSDVRIESVWLSVVKFINWYNHLSDDERAN